MLKKSLILLILILVISSVSVLATSGDKVAAVVNDQKIMVKEVDQFAHLNQKLLSISKVDKLLANLLVSSPSGKKVLTEYRRKELQNLITRKLLIEEAAKQKITITESEKKSIFNQQIKKIEQKHNWSEKELLTALNKQGYKSLKEYRKFFFRKYNDLILIGKLKKSILTNKSFEVTDAEIKDYYDKHQDKYTESGQLKPLTKVREKIKKTLLQQKENRYWQEYIKQVVAKAKIEIRL